jgi:hypothetical protein
MRSSTQHFEQLAETLSQVATEMAVQLRETKEAGRRLEIAIYVAIGITLVQLFNLVFEVFSAAVSSNTMLLLGERTTVQRTPDSQMLLSLKTPHPPSS